MTFDVLVASLPSLRRAPGAAPWDVRAFLGWLCSTGLSHGEQLAARFVLGVWNTETDWVAEATKDGLPFPQNARRFDLLEAVGVWDSSHLQILRAWLASPQFP